jgi:hypothetical protein
MRRLLPRQHGVVGAHPGEHGGDGVTVADDDPVDAAHLAGLGAMPSRRAAPTSASAASGRGR